MTGKWLERIGFVCFLGGIVLVFLSLAGLFAHEWVWAPLVYGLSLVFACQVLTALAEVLRRLRVLEEVVSRIADSDKIDSNQPSGGTR